MIALITFIEPTWVYEFVGFAWACDTDRDGSRATEKALNRLKQGLAGTNANAVVSVQLATVSNGSSFTVWIYGTAIRVTNW